MAIVDLTRIRLPVFGVRKDIILRDFCRLDFEIDCFGDVSLSRKPKQLLFLL